jgi:hypothetical protein
MFELLLCTRFSPELPYNITIQVQEIMIKWASGEFYNIFLSSLVIFYIIRQWLWDSFYHMRTCSEINKNEVVLAL